MQESIYLGGGCFWCTQSVFEMLRGVQNVTSGYMGGDFENPTYEDVCTLETNHAEVVKVEFDNELITLQTLLDVFFAIHDPTTKNRQGNDIGTQYRSVIFYETPSQKETIEKSLESQQAHFSSPIVTEIKAADLFYEAEEYHQGYFSKNPQNGYCNFAIPPKIEKLKKHFFAFLKE